MQNITSVSTPCQWEEFSSLLRRIFRSEIHSHVIVFILLLGAITSSVHAQTNTWDGSSNSSWHEPTNWSLNQVPTVSHDVIIPNGVSLLISITSGAVCNSLTMEGGDMDNTIVMLGAGTLTVTNAISIYAGLDTGGGGDDKLIDVRSGTLICGSLFIEATTDNVIESKITATTGTVEINGNVTMNSPGPRNAISFSDAGTLILHGSITGGTITGPCTVVYANTGSYALPVYSYHNLELHGNTSLTTNQSITGNLVISSEGTLTLGQYNMTINADANRSATINGTLEIDGDGRLLELLGGVKTLITGPSGFIDITDIGGSTLPVFDAYNFNASSTVQYGATDAQTIETSPVYGNLATSGSGTKTFENSEGISNIAGSVTIGTGTTLASNDIVLNIGGGWTNNGTFTQGLSEVHFNGSGSQAYSGSTTFYTLNIENTGSGILMSDDITVQDVLTLTSGLVHTGTNSVVLSSSATGSVSGGSGSAYIDGTLVRAIASGGNVYSYAIGSNTAFAPVSLTFSSGTGSGVLAGKTINGDNPNIATSTLDPNGSINRYWNFSVESGLTGVACDMVLNWPSADADPGFDETSSNAGKYNGAVWSYPTIGTRTSNSIELINIIGFSDFQVSSCVAPEFTSQPQDVSECQGNPVTFMVTVTSPDAVNYQWYKVGEGMLTNDGRITGAQTATLSIDPVLETDAGNYFVIADRQCGTMIVSAEAVLTVLEQVNYGTVNSTNETICNSGDPSDITFSTSPSGGTGQFSYQWYYKDGSATCPTGSSTSGWTLITSATNNHYDPPAGLGVSRTYAVQVDMTGTPDCEDIKWATGCRKVIINNVSPGIIVGNQTICYSTNPPPVSDLLPGSATGTLSYQWQSSTIDCASGFTDISGASAASYDPPVNLTQTTYYRRATISTLNGVSCIAYSNCITITVLPNVDYGTLTAGDEFACPFGDPSIITMSVPPSGGAGSFAYQWYYKDGINNCPNGASTSGWTEIPMATNSSYNPPAGLQVSRTYALKVEVLGDPDCGNAKWADGCRKITMNSVNAGLIDDNQIICSGGDPVSFINLVSASGSGTLSYQWQKSTGGCNSGFTDIMGATSLVYDPPPGLLVSTYYRRIVTSTLSAYACSDTSNCLGVLINISDGGVIAGNQTICPGDMTATLTQTTASFGSGALSYQWQSSTTDCLSGFTNISGASSLTYNPGVVTVTTYFRRMTTSDVAGIMCSDPSNCVTVLVNTVDGGQIGSDQTICLNGDPAAFVTTIAASGGGALTYQWQSSTGDCNGGFTDIPMATSQSYDPPSGLSVTTFYRRMVTSDLNGAICSAYSNCVSVIINNVSAGGVGGDQTICSLGDPIIFESSSSGSGDGTITYQWQSGTTDCLSGFSDISSATTETYDPPPGLTETTYYRRLTISTLNSVPCEAVSNCVIVIINDVTAGAIDGNQNICPYDDAATLNEIVSSTGSGDISYQWQSSTTNCTDGFIDIPSATLSSYDPMPGEYTVTTFFRRVTTSTLFGSPCEAISNCIEITVNAVSAGSITGDETICYGGDPSVITTNIAASGSGILTYQWQSSTGCTGIFMDIPAASSESYDPPSGLTGQTCYRRVTTSESNGIFCEDISNVVTVTLLEPVDYGTIESGDENVCSGGDPSIINLAVMPSGGSETFQYQWYYQDGLVACPTGTNTSGWTAIPSASSTSYDPPPGLTQSRTYALFVDPAGSPDCGDASWAAGCRKVTAFGTALMNVSLNDPGVITQCSGGNPATISVTTPTGGDGAYEYQWEQSSGCTGTWQIAIAEDGITNTLSLNPPVLSLPVMSMCYRLRVTDGCGSLVHSDVKTYLISADPMSPMINPNIPSGSVVCLGDFVSATFDPGTGGAGIITDTYEYTVDSGMIWQPYNSGDQIQITPSLIGINKIRIRSLRTASGTGCDPAAYNVVQWSVDPFAPNLITCPQNLQLEGCDTDVIQSPLFASIKTPSTYSIFSGDDNLGEATDNCGITEIHYQDSITGTCPIVVLRTWTLTDSAQNVTQCIQTITVSPPAIVFECPEDQLEPACQTQGAIDTAFTEWLQSIIATGGCDANLSHSAAQAPSACGGTTSVTWTYMYSCPPFTTECTSIFTVESPPTVEFQCAVDHLENACQTQGAIDTAFMLWLETTTASGGCNGQLSHTNAMAPSACGGSTDVTWTYISTCAPFVTECTKTFTVTPAPAVIFNCAVDRIEAACQTQGAVDTAFAAWLQTTTAGGGCNGALTNNADAAPSACGGSVDVTWTYASTCAPFVTECTKTFTVTPAPAVVFDCAVDQTEAACQSQAEIDAAFQIWLQTTTASGGCNGILTNNADAAPSACGGSVDVTWTYASTCAPFITECTKTFTVTPAPAVVFNCAVDQTEAACQTQGAVDAAFAAWLQTTSASGGCDGVLTNDAGVAPSACGGSVDVTWTYTSTCAPFVTECTKTFTVTPAPEVVFNCAVDQTEAACQTQGAIDVAYAEWLQSTTASSGCNGILTNDAHGAPPSCGGSDTVTWTYASTCEPFITQCTRIFTVTPAPQVELVCVNDQTEAACQTQGAIDTAFTIWLSQTMANGGCNGILSNDAGAAPSACGGSVTITWTYTSTCTPFTTTCSATFTVTAPDEVVLTCIGDETEPACQTQGAIDAAFAVWLGQTTAGGGCGGVLTNDAGAAPSACGGSTTVTWTYTSTCVPFVTMCSATFTVTAPDAIEFTCAEDQTEMACQTQGAIDQAYAAWLQSTTASGGCNASLSNDAGPAPSACGGSTTVNWTYTSTCAPFITTCSATFTVAAPDIIELLCAEDQTEAACQTQGAIDAAFVAWLQTTTASGGCNTTLSHDAGPAPSACGGSTLVTWTYESMCPPLVTTCSATFTVADAPDVVLTCAENHTEPSCQTQHTIDSLFGEWLQTTTASGGCNGALTNDATTAPPACGGTTTVTWTYSSSCDPTISQCSATFTVISVPNVNFTCATNQTEQPCQTQGAIDTAFALWLESTTANASCSGILSNNSNGAPSACGGSATVTWTYTSLCVAFDTQCTKTFTVIPADDVQFVCANNHNEAACQTQGAIDTAFAIWIETATASGGCNGVMNNNAGAAPSACGGSVDVTWTYTNDCDPQITECTRTFSVDTAPAVEFQCAEDHIEPACQTQLAINAAFQLWLESTTATGGCDGVLTNNSTTSPLACGGSRTVTWTYTSSCPPYISECTRTFTVAIPQVSFTCAEDHIEPACQTQAAIDANFMSWVESVTASGGCDGVLINNAGDAPSACGGSVDVTWTYTQSCLPSPVQCTRTFTVQSAAPVAVQCAENFTFPACLTQGDIEGAFQLWLASTSASGGCNGVLTHTPATAPPACGGTTSVTWTYTSDCAPFITQCTRTFTVDSPQPLMFVCASDYTTAPCLTQTTVDSLFLEWLQSVVATGGCNAELSNNAFTAPPACGGSATVTWIYTSDCTPFNPECTRTFTVPPAPAVVLTCASDHTEAACQTQGAIDIAFAEWLTTTTATGGCNGVLTNDATTAPDACGGSTTVTWTYTSSCAPFVTQCSKTFTVSPAPEIALSCPGNQTELACQTQSAIDIAFSQWVGAVTASGGCNGELSNNATTAPPACGGSVDVTWTYTSSCAPFLAECTRTFTVEDAPEVVLTCAGNQTESACQTQNAIDMAFQQWVQSTTAIGGCNGMLTNNAGSAPSACGGSTTVIWTYTSTCAPFVTECSATFTVDSAPVISMSCALDRTESACQTQGAIDIAFANWLATTTASGGCNGILVNDAGAAPSACGGSALVTWTYTSSCAPFETTCSATFTVDAAPTVQLTCAGNHLEPACQTQSAIDNAFATWLASTTASGGCNGVLTNDANGAPSVCGGSTTVTWTYTSSCAPFTTTCSSTFTVEAPPVIDFVCAVNQTEAACQTQAAIDIAYANWLATTTASGGCSGVLINDAGPAPSACGGSSTVTWTYTSSCAPFVTTCTKTFIVESPPVIDFVCAVDQTEAACQTQAAIDIAFAQWLATTTATGGCNGVLTNDAGSAPSACGGSSTVTWTYTSSCAPFMTTCTKTFTVEQASQVVFNCTINQTEPACQTQGAIDSAFTTWVESVSASGGCNGILSNNATMAPSACGGATTVTWTYESSCAPFITDCSRTFSVTPAPAVVLVCPGDQTEPACQTQAAIDNAFALWLSGVVASGGCNGVLTSNATTAPSACGGNTTVTWSYVSSCDPILTECSATFTVSDPPEVELLCADNHSEPSCQTQQAIDMAFANWLSSASASGGCNGSLMHNATNAPSACGGSVDVTWVYTSSCEPFTTQCTRTFTVDPPPAIQFTCAVDQSESSCQTQGAIDVAFAVWLSSVSASGGCDGILTHNGVNPPSICGGSTTVTWTYTTSCAPFVTECSRTFTVDPPPAIQFTCAVDQTEAACQTQSAINSAFSQWLLTTTASGGCNGILTNDATNAPPACGGSVDVIWTYTSSCAPFTTTCTKTFTVTTAPLVELICAEDHMEPACQTQSAIDNAFTQWLATASANGGCNGVLSNNAASAPSACGGSTDVTWTYTSSCAPSSTTCTKTFTVEQAPQVIFNCANDQTEAACQTQGAIDAAFDDWVSSVSANGGCNGILTNDAGSAPSACGGSTTVTWTYTSTCAPFITQCSRTFSVTPSPTVVLTCPDNHIEQSCQTQSAIDVAFALWLGEVTASGGCNGVLTNNAVDAPDACGGSTTVIWSYQSSCAPTLTQCSATFTVEAAPEVVLVCAVNHTEPACQDQQSIDSAFANWLSTATTSGGCDGEITNNATSAPPACGGSVSVTWTYSSSCAPFTTECTRIFTVEAAPAIQFICADDHNEPACQTQTAIDIAFDTWLNTTTASGSCDGVLTHNGTTAPLACGGSVDVTWTYTSSCAPFITQCTRTFTVTTSPAVEFSCAEDHLEPACQTQAAIDVAFATWLSETSASGGCDGVLSHSPAIAPSACGGSTIVTWTYTSSCAPFVTECTRTFTVQTAPIVQFTCTTNRTEVACQTQTAIDAAFAGWLGETTASGGCNGVLSNNAVNAPSACGGSVDVTWTYTSSCAPFVTQCTRTFTVDQAPAVQFTCAVNQTEVSCQTQAAINTAFSQWVSSVTASGGCNGVLSNNAVSAPSACGGSVNVTWIYTSSCAPFVTECTRMFTVEAAPTVTVACPSGVLQPTCASQANINTAFASWTSALQQSISGGCAPQVTYRLNGQIVDPSQLNPPSACVASLMTIQVQYSDLCASGSCSSVFVVEGPAPLTINCPTDVLLSACAPQSVVNAAFNNWVSDLQNLATGGCGLELTYSINGIPAPDLSSLSAPTACAGGSVFVTCGYSDMCNSGTCSSSFVLPANTGPVLSNTPSDQTYNTLPSGCQRTIPITKPVVDDDCDETPGLLITANDPNIGFFDFGGYWQAEFPVGVTLITIAVIDACGNTATHAFSITINDVFAPTITGCPANIVKGTTIGNCGANVSWTPPIASDNCPGVTLSSNYLPGAFFPRGVSTVVYTATDVSGHVSTCSFTVTVNDVNPPVFSCNALQTINLQAFGPSCQVTIELPVPVANDNCDGVIVASGVRSDGQPITAPWPANSSTLVTWTMTDNSGNSTVCSQTINVSSCTWPSIYVYVDSSKVNGGQTGVNWANALLRIEDALALTSAFPNIQQIWVAGGTYKPTQGSDRTSCYSLTSNIKLLGGFAGVVENLSDRNVITHPTTMSGDIGAVGNVSDNSYHVVKIGATVQNASIDGFIITNGNANGGMLQEDIAGGILNLGQLSLINCKVKANLATTTGAAIVTTGAGALLILKDCTIQANSCGDNRDVMLKLNAQMMMQSTNTIDD